MARAAKRALFASVVAGAAAVVIARQRAKSSLRVARGVELARLGGGVGSRWATHQARRVFASAERRDELDRDFELRSAEQVSASLGNMKGVLMKLGQMASYVNDNVPPHVRETLAQLQQDAPPMSEELAAQVIEQELGRQPDKVFAEWDPTPIAAASIGQVHRAITHDGVPVAVKVQYPGVDEAIKADLDNTDALTSFASFIAPGFDHHAFVAELRDRFLEELDYRLEADNQQLFADFYKDHPFISIPRVLPALSTGRVLTTELATGARFAELDNWSQEERNLAGETIFRFVFRGIYRLHAFNGDPHPGNYLFSPGGRVTFLDFGLVKRFTPDEIRMFERMADSLLVRGDLDAYRQEMTNAGVLMKGAAVSDDRLREYFGYYYEPVLEDRVWTFTIEYASKAIEQLFPVGNENADIRKIGNLPPAFIIMQRINLGMSAVLAHLHATANWRKIGEELWPFVDGPPSTPMGEAEARWLAAKTR